MDARLPLSLHDRAVSCYVLSIEKWNCLEEGGHRRGGYAFMMSWNKSSKTQRPDQFSSKTDWIATKPASLKAIEAYILLVSSIKVSVQSQVRIRPTQRETPCLENVKEFSMRRRGKIESRTVIISHSHFPSLVLLFLYMRISLRTDWLFSRSRALARTGILIVFLYLCGDIDSTRKLILRWTALQVSNSIQIESVVTPLLAPFQTMKLLGSAEDSGGRGQPQPPRSQDDAAVGYVFQRHVHDPEFSQFAQKQHHWASGDDTIMDVSAILAYTMIDDPNTCALSRTRTSGSTTGWWTQAEGCWVNPRKWATAHKCSRWWTTINNYSSSSKCICTSNLITWRRRNSNNPITMRGTCPTTTWLIWVHSSRCRSNRISPCLIWRLRGCLFKWRLFKADCTTITTRMDCPASSRTHWHRERQKWMSRWCIWGVVNISVLCRSRANTWQLQWTETRWG